MPVTVRNRIDNTPARRSLSVASSSGRTNIQDESPSIAQSDDHLEDFGSDGQTDTQTRKRPLNNYAKLRARPNIHVGKHHFSTFKEYCTAFNVNVLQEEDKHR